MRGRLLRSLRRAGKWAGAGVLSFLLLYATLASALPRIAVNRDHRPPADGITVYVESNGVHADFVVPVRTSVVDWGEHLPPEWFASADRTCRWLSIGWGDKGFYLNTPTWRDLTVATASKAVFFLGSAAMHVTYLRFEPAPGERCRRLVLAEEQYARLTHYLLDSFARDDQGRPRRIDHPGYTAQDRFFDARGTYSLIHTCNEWTGGGLRTIGVRTGVWTPFPDDVLRHLPQ